MLLQMSTISDNGQGRGEGAMELGNETITEQWGTKMAWEFFGG